MVVVLAWPRLQSIHMLRRVRNFLPAEALIRRTGLLIPEPRTEGTYMEWLGLVGIISLVILMCVYVFEKSSNQIWPGLTKPIFLIHIFRDWMAYMALFIGLLILLEGTLRLACSIGC
ncbi:MAG: hypothetical protein K0S58_1327 [Nitrospira sp.]|jgi:hypothetical protein|nr:hypothetical protein [Nitrospira sp.]